MKKLTSPIKGLHFLRINSVVTDTTHRLIHFPHLTMQIKFTLEMSAKPLVVLFDGALTIPLSTTKPVTAFVDHPSEWNTTGTVTPLGKFTESASFLTSQSMSAKVGRKVAVRLINTTLYSIKRNTQIDEFSAVNLEQAKFLQPVDMAIVNMIPEGDPDVTASLNGVLTTNKREQPRNTFCFPTRKNPG